MQLDDRSGSAAFELLASLTARLASTARLDEIVDTVLSEIVTLGFGAVWMAVLDEPTGNLLTLKEVIDGVDTTHEMPKIFMLDMRQPIGHGFRERKMINIAAPDALHIIERDGDPVPEGKLALPRVIFEHMRGHPFACGPLLGSRGQPVGALGLSSYLGKRPIPDQLFTHGLLRAFMDHLGIAMERAMDLARLEQLNANLVRAQAAITGDARIKAVGELAAAVAHDLNNLSGIALMSVSVGMRSAAAAVDALPRIERANRAIGDLVARLQRVARPSAIDGEATDLRQIVEDILIMVAPLLRERVIRLEAELPEVPLVRCDPVMIHRLVLNLIINAHDALAGVSAEQRSLRVGLRGEGAAVRLTVSDTGPGIAPEILARLFQPFITSKPSPHLGLGLAAAHASLKHLGGELEGRNAPGGGAIFEVTLRAAPASAQPVAPAPAPLAAPRGRRILAVDDDADVAFIICAYLEPLGHHVVTVLNADQAIEKAANEPFDLVLCDIGMPKRSGLEVCQVLRESGFRGKIVLMTGWDPEVLRADERASESDMLLKKPFQGTDLIRVIDTLLPS
jgi:signal transduction histidine kinase